MAQVTIGSPMWNYLPRCKWNHALRRFRRCMEVAATGHLVWGLVPGGRSSGHT